MDPQPHSVERAIARLRSLHDDLGVLDVIACGEQAVPALRTVLFERERSGLFQIRCRAVEALSALRAHSVLIEFLEAERMITDPVERVGEDAVISAAALALVSVRQPHVHELLLRLARRPALTGVIAALGTLGGSEAVLPLINALEEDGSRLTAENALRRLGQPARAALLRTLDLKVPTAEAESESSARRRRSALRLLAEMDRSQGLWPNLRHLMLDKDAKVAALACEIGLARSSAPDRTRAIRHLIELLSRDDWLLREEIESCLVAHYDRTRDAIASFLSEIERRADGAAARAQIESILRRIIARAQSEPQAPQGFSWS